ncbi:MAG: hypothetical protein KA746_14080 [Pyrinomonadaceae bacterium]|nr:hypothetical protein [Pyrinomonadaceae bacterium]MBP6211822.1 hypothetical protein [Pyrinomonadaceae bacterium]
MNVFETDDRCPKCHEPNMKSWDELTSDEKMVAQRLPAAAAYPPSERKKHRICTRCWFEETVQKTTVA